MSQVWTVCVVFSPRFHVSTSPRLLVPCSLRSVTMILLRKNCFNMLLSKKKSKEARIALKDQPTNSPSFIPYPKDSFHLKTQMKTLMKPEKLCSSTESPVTYT